MARNPIDHKLVLKVIPVHHVNGTDGDARAEGNNAAWSCACGTQLLGRCYYQFGDTCHTECPSCGRIFRVAGDEKKRAVEVIEQAA
jgi:hypothetical protein